MLSAQGTLAASRKGLDPPGAWALRLGEQATVSVGASRPGPVERGGPPASPGGREGVRSHQISPGFSPQRNPHVAGVQLLPLLNGPGVGRGRPSPGFSQEGRGPKAPVRPVMGQGEAVRAILKPWA